MANKSIRDLRRKKQRELRKKRKRKLIKIGVGAFLLIAAFKIDFTSSDNEKFFTRNIENRTAQANKKEEAEQKQEKKTQIATPLGFEDVVIDDGLQVQNDGYQDYMKAYVKAVNTQYCYQQPSDYTKTDLSINKGDYIQYYGTENSFSKIKIDDNFYYVNRYGLSKLKENEKITVVKGVVFVNKNNPLPEDFNPGLDSTSSNALNTMINTMNREGLNLKVDSDFRMASTEEKLLDQEHIDGDSPLESEHQTGTAFDFFTDGYKYTDKFKETDEYKWLKENAYKYGFIERYTKEKESITGKKERPWHFRYVGVENAKDIYENNLSLEEFLKIN